MSATTESAWLAVDTGGTFTDLVLLQGGRIHVAKVPSTPADPAEAILQGIDQLSRRLGGRLQLGGVIHGSTVATNAVLERRGARTAFITNRGFADLLAIGRQNRPRLYDLRVDPPPALVPAGDCHGVSGRVEPDGRMSQPLDEAEVEALARDVAVAGYEAVAICLLLSSANHDHERRVAAALLDASDGLSVSTSSEILPRFREYERACATVLNAYVQPTMRRYLQRLGETLDAQLLVVQSDGGMVGAAEAGARPVHTLLSGPAGGVVGAHRAGREAGQDRLIAFDMGGTSTDVSLIDGQPSLTSESTIAGIPLAVTTVDLHTVGAGGGSLAWLDDAGALKVGPQSAGADPGPACYGRSDRPTVTDANVVLERLPAAAFLGGDLVLDADAARRAIASLAEPLNLSVEATAAGIVEVANAHMVRAIKVISLERGHDPRDFHLMSFGGAGGLHAVALADALQLRSVLVPTHPGLLSAVGMLGAEITCELTHTLLARFEPDSPADVARFESTIAVLDRRANAFLAAHDVPPDRRRIDRIVDCRYRGQSFEIAVDAPPNTNVVAAFHERHEWRYGYRLDRPVEWVAIRLRARGQRETTPPGRVDRPQPVASAPPAAESNRWSIVARAGLTAGERLNGPLVVTEYSSTTWLPPGWRLTVLEDGTLQLERA